MRAVATSSRSRSHAPARISPALVRVLSSLVAILLILAQPARAIPPDQTQNVTFTITRSVYCSLTVIGSNTIQWAALADWSTQYYGADTQLNVTVQMVTSPSGSASVVLQSPANLIGAQGHVLDLSLISVLASFQGNLSWKGAPYVPLIPSGTASLYTMAADKAVDSTFFIFFEIDDRNLPIDTWSSSGFTMIATST